MNSIRLNLSKSKNKLTVGSSKFFGNPDVADNFEWPVFETDGDFSDLTFMCQINCSEISAYDKDNLLPKSGILYFFYALDEMPSDPYCLNAAKVIYYNGDLSNLHELTAVDEFGNETGFDEIAVEFENVTEGFLSDSEDTHLLLGIPSLDSTNIPECIYDWQMLLQIDSMQTDQFAINFTDEGILCFYIDPKKLKCKDFTDVRIWQIYS